MRSAPPAWFSPVAACAVATILIAPKEPLAQQHPARDIWANLAEVRAYLDSAARETRSTAASLDSTRTPVVCSRRAPRSWDDVTVRRLLTHSSGIADHFGDLESVPVEQTVEELHRVLDALPPDEPLRAAPGTEYAYSNFNYVLVAALLERVVGASWETILREWIFEPLGLRTMAYDDVYAIMEDRVRGYERDDTLGLRNIDYDDHAAYAAGGLLSSAGDVFRWSRGMLTGKLFGSRLVAESLVPYQGDYGYGWQVRRFFDRRIYNHSGGIDGFSSHLAHYPDEGLTIVVLSNVENDSAILRACDVAGRLFDWPVVTVSEGAELTPRQRCGLER